MKIGVLTDTHAVSFSELHDKMKDALSKVDIIVHAGDFVSMDILKGLKSIKKVEAVHGNMDSVGLRLLLKEREILTVGGKQIGLTHGSGAPDGIEKRIKMMFNNVDVIIYGHSHVRQNKVIDNVLFFNPGPSANSLGILTMDYNEVVKGEFVEL